MLGMRVGRSGRTARSGAKPDPDLEARPSVREVCLLGGASAGAGAGMGGRLSWSGRLYRVEAVETSGPAGRYLHLAPIGEA